jgi:phi LC3 family holin
MFNIVPKIAEDELVNLLIMLVELLSMVGIVTDPTTKGIGDSSRALTYEQPYEDGE